MKPIIIIIFNLLIITTPYSYANNWLQAKLTYNQTIDNKPFPAKVTLLRPESYFMENRVTKKGEKLTVNLPEMGLDNIAMDIVSIKPFKMAGNRDTPNTKKLGVKDRSERSKI